MPAQGDFIRITALGTLLGATNPVINVWDYEVLTLTAPVGLQEIGDEIASAFVARYYTPLAGVISNKYSLTGLSMRTYGKPFEGWDGADAYFIGGITGTMMPPFVSYSIMRLRNNFSMKPGRKAFAGVPTYAITENGTVLPAYEAIFSNVFDAWESTDFAVELNDGDLVLADRLIRNADLQVVPTVRSGVSGYQVKGFGSQNGRKG
jgi:hypothetical protein